jgi:hypothetical protein
MEKNREKNTSFSTISSLREEAKKTIMVTEHKKTRDGD